MLLQSLVEQVAKLNEALAAQQVIQMQMQEELRKARTQNRALRSKLLALSKRSREAGLVDGWGAPEDAMDEEADGAAQS